MSAAAKAEPPKKPKLAERSIGEPVAETQAEQPLLIKRADLVAASLLGLLVIALVAVLYFAKPFLLPVAMAFVIGTMLAPVATFLERHRIPRPVSAVAIVALVAAGVALLVSLIVAPVMQWASRLPELAGTLREKLQVFDGPLAVLRRIGVAFGVVGPNPSSFQMPKFEWMQPTLLFLSPTLAEILLFVATLILFIASWGSLRRSLVMTFAHRAWRLRALKILNAIETSLGGYLLTVTTINFGVGVGTGLICAVTGMPSPASLGAMAAVLNFLPYIGPVMTFVVLTAVGLVFFPTIGDGLLAPAAFAAMTLVEGHFITPAIIGRRLELNALAVFVTLAFWTWLWGPMGGFLAGPLLVVGLVMKEHLVPDTGPQLPDD